jgi:hypothetical protein
MINQQTFAKDANMGTDATRYVLTVITCKTLQALTEQLRIVLFNIQRLKERQG